MEKTAGPVSKAVFDSIGGALKLMGKYPKTTLGLMAGTAGTIALANKLHPLHQMFREETKNRILKDQNVILRNILEQGKRGVAVEPKSQKLIISPLT